MNFDDIKNQWAAFDKKLELNLRLNVRLQRDSGLRKANSALRRMLLSVFLEVLIGLACAGALITFIGNHFREWPFLAPAIALNAFVVFHIVFGIYQLTVLRGVDFSAPILVSQKKLATLRLRRIRVTMWTLLLSPLLWVPLLIVMLKGLVGVNAYAILDAGWLVANVLFGVAIIPLMLWVSRRYAEHWQRSSFMHHLMDDIAGRSLNEATTFLDELASFEQETEPA